MKADKLDRGRDFRETAWRHSYLKETCFGSHRTAHDRPSVNNNKRYFYVPDFFRISFQKFVLFWPTLIELFSNQKYTLAYLNLELTIFGPNSNHHVIFWSNVAPSELMWPLVPFKTSHMTDGTTKEWSPGTLFRFQEWFSWIFMVS